MADEPRSNRPTPRTAAAIEAELRRRIRSELEQARSESDGALDDAALASIIARAVVAAVEWHLQAPEHTRNATLSSRTWRPAGGPRGGGNRNDEFEDRGPRRPPRDFDRESRPTRDFDRPPPRDFDRESRPPRDFDRPPPRDYDRPPRDGDRPPPRNFDRPPRDYDRPAPRDYGRDDRPPRDFDRPPRGPRQGRPPARGGGGFKRGGFKPRRPPKR